MSKENKNKENRQDAEQGLMLLLAFVGWTLLIQYVDVQAVGPRESCVGLAALNVRFHRLTGVHWWLYTVTDWLGLVPIGICLVFAGLGLVQVVRRRSLIQVDIDLIYLGVYYLAVMGCYLLFERIPINYRPLLIAGVLEASYPSSTVLLVLSVLPTLTFQAERRSRNSRLRRVVRVGAALFSWLTVGGRVLSGVHWLSDIVGAVFLSRGLFRLYRTAASRKRPREEG